MSLKRDKNLAKLNYGQPKPSSFLRFPARFPYKFVGWWWVLKLKPIFSPFQAILNNFDLSWLRNIF